MFITYYDSTARLLEMQQTAKLYRGAGKSIARPRRKQVTATEDFEFHIPHL